jgi:hypothetical protein
VWHRFEADAAKEKILAVSSLIYIPNILPKKNLSETISAKGQNNITLKNLTPMKFTL